MRGIDLQVGEVDLFKVSEIKINVQSRKKSRQRHHLNFTKVFQKVLRVCLL